MILFENNSSSYHKLYSIYFNLDWIVLTEKSDFLSVISDKIFQNIVQIKFQRLSSRSPPF